jgi:RimJ/RimL family protein N-acetyltransferase
MERPDNIVISEEIKLAKLSPANFEDLNWFFQAEFLKKTPLHFPLAELIPAEMTVTEYQVYYNNKSSALVSVKEESGEAVFGYYVNKEMQGKGIITESLRAIIQKLSGDKKIKKFRIDCPIFNFRSRNIAIELGFELVQVKKWGTKVHGSCEDIAVYFLEK